MRHRSAVIPRELLDKTTTPDGRPIELAKERGHYIIRVDGVPLMSSVAHGSEEAMALVAARTLAGTRQPKVLVGGLGMGFTLRAALEAFSPDGEITVAELLPAVIGYNRGVLGHLADHPLDDERVILVEGDVRKVLKRREYDAILLDVDNGPEALTVASNASLYDKDGVKRLAGALRRGGLLVVWSAYPSKVFEQRLSSAGLSSSTQQFRARGSKGARHTLFMGRR